MIPYEDIKKIYKDLVEDRIMKWPLRAIVIVIAVAVCIEVPWYFIDKIHGKHAKLFWGLSESNIRIDTITKFKVDTLRIPPVIHDQPKTKINNNKIRDVNTLNQ